MHKSRLGTMIIDCKTDDLHSQARFWSAALGLKPEQAAGQVNSKYIRLEGDDRDVQILLQAVDHESRIHLDIETDDREAEVSRLGQLGATVVNRSERWTVMEAPSGHRFCIIGPARTDFETNANCWPTTDPQLTINHE